MRGLGLPSLTAVPCLLLLFLGCGGTSTSVAPTITGFTPSSGVVATTVTVTGTGFSSGLTSVTLGGVTVASTTGTIVSATELTFPVPTAAVTGAITLVGSGGTATSATEFIVTPVITTLSPVTGSASEGTPVTISGSGLMGITQIAFGTTVASPTTQTANEIIVPVPAGANVGVDTVTFTINSSYDLANLLSSFTVTN